MSLRNFNRRTIFLWASSASGEGLALEALSSGLEEVAEEKEEEDEEEGGAEVGPAPVWPTSAVCLCLKPSLAITPKSSSNRLLPCPSPPFRRLLASPPGSAFPSSFSCGAKESKVVAAVSGSELLLTVTVLGEECCSGEGEVRSCTEDDTEEEETVAGGVVKRCSGGSAVCVEAQASTSTRRRKTTPKSRVTSSPTPSMRAMGSGG